MSSAQKGMRALIGCASFLNHSAAPASGSGLMHTTRSIGTWVPEYFGKKSKYTEGTNFLGTPPDHLERTKNRPLSPDVMDIDGKAHYKFPVAALTSITTRVTGVAMSVGFFGAGAIALTGDLPGTVEYVKSWGMLVTVPTKTLVAFPIVYHYIAGVRHLVWDNAAYNNQIEKDSVLELDEVKKSSMALLYTSGAVSLMLGLYYY